MGVFQCFCVFLRTKGQGTKPRGFVFFFFFFLNEAIGLPYLTRWIKCGEKITEFNQHSHSVYVVRNNHSKKHMEN